MNHLIVFSHPNPNSFNNAIKETLKKALLGQGCEVRVRDLYALEWDSFLTQEEMISNKEEKFSQDVLREHEHIRWADVITFIGPLWWGSFPAVAKDYLDRVLCDGFAYTSDENGPKGLLSDKKVFTIMTGDAPDHVYEQNGLFQNINKIWDEIFCSFCALNSIGHKYFMAVSVVSDEQRKAMLEEVQQIALQINK